MITKKIVMALVAFLMVTTAQAQWRVGVTGGADYNVFSMDQQYMTDYKVDGRWGITLGVSGQYDVNEWLGVRADLNLTQKNYRHSRVVYSDVDYKFTNNYLQLPVMASFSFGGERLRGFCNLGVYLPSVATFTLDHKIIEGEGITPDIEVDLNEAEFVSTGKDSQLDRALQFLRTGN